MRYSWFACTGLALFALAGCVITTPTPAPVPGYPAPPPPLPTVLDPDSREVARNAINVEMQKNLQGVYIVPYTNCVMNNASTDELLGIAQASRAAAPDLNERVAAIVKRPATGQCIAGVARAA